MIRARSFRRKARARPGGRASARSGRQARAQPRDDLGRQRREPGAAGERVEEHPAVLDLHDRAGAAAALEAQDRCRKRARPGHRVARRARSPPSARRGLNLGQPGAQGSADGGALAALQPPRPELLRSQGRRAGAPSAVLARRRARARWRAAGPVAFCAATRPVAARFAAVELAPPRAPVAESAKLGRRSCRPGLGGGAFLFGPRRFLRQGERLGAAWLRGGLLHAWRRERGRGRGGHERGLGALPHRLRRASAHGNGDGASAAGRSVPRGRRGRGAGGRRHRHRGRGLLELSSLRAALASSVFAAGSATAAERARASSVARAYGCLRAASFAAVSAVADGGAAFAGAGVGAALGASRRRRDRLAPGIRQLRGRLAGAAGGDCFSLATETASCAGVRAGPRSARGRAHRLVHRPVPPEHADQGRGHHAGEAGRDLRPGEPRPERESASGSDGAAAGARSLRGRGPGLGQDRLAQRRRRRRARIRRVAQRLAQPGVVLRPAGGLERRRSSLIARLPVSGSR